MRSNHVLVIAGVVAGTLSITAAVADAHVSISSGPAFANKSQKITFSVGHGCEGSDTLRIRVEIPAGLTSVRAVRSDFGRPSLRRNAESLVTEVTWQKPDGEVLTNDGDAPTNDYGYYELTIRARIADVPFTKIYFKVHQLCRTAAGVDHAEEVHWSTLPGETGTNPAAALVVVPARQPGWNKFVLGAGIASADLPTYFADALIVWRGTAAYSANVNTAALIGTTSGVTAITDDLLATQEIWARY